MNTSYNENPILPAPGVSRNFADDTDAGRSLNRQNEDAILNRVSRRAVSDSSGSSSALLRCKSTVKIGTYNANTLRNVNKAMELVQCSYEHGISILGIQEHRIIHDDPIEFKTIGSSYLITSSGWRNEAQASQGGVGLLLDVQARKSLLKAKSISRRIMIVEFDGNPKTTVIVIYSPTNCADEDEMEVFYNDLRTTLLNVPAHNFVVCLGDFNARLGHEVAPYTFHDETNRNGKYLEEILTEYNLIATNTQFQKRSGKLWTFKDRAAGSRRQLDYLLVRKKWRNSIMNSEAYNTFCSVGSDHRVVCASVRLSLRISKQAKKTKYDWKMFYMDNELQNKYTISVRNKYQILANDTNETKFNKFVDANKSTMDELLPKKARSKVTLRSSNFRVAMARHEVQQTHNQYMATKTTVNKENHSRAQRNMYEVYQQEEEKELEKEIQSIEIAHGGQKYGEAWRVVNEITGRKRAKEGQVTGSSPEERVKTWFNHFRKLLGSPPEVEEPDEEIPNIYEELGINDDVFSMEEFRKVKASLKIGKAAGPDDIPPEVLKACDFDEICLDFCNEALLNNDKPNLWSLMNIIPVPKSGDLTKTDNYRGISLTCILAKMFNRMILNRIRDVIDFRLRINQNGFRTNRSTVSQILTLRRIIEGVKENNIKSVMTFIDFRKAFDSIHRGKMIRILKAYGIPPKLLHAIEKMYTNTKAKVITPDGETEMFEITTGVLQGDTLAPFLFIIVLDYAMRKALVGREDDLGFTLSTRKSRRHAKETLTDLDFADDIALISDEICQAQEMLLRVEKECKKVGLEINTKKTKSIAFNTDNTTKLHTADGNELEWQDDFKYLGSWVGSSEKDIRVRKAQAWKALNGMSAIWKSNMNNSLKIRLFVATIESILLYGCESWSLTKMQEKSLDGTYTRMLRRVLNIGWNSHTSNIQLYSDLPKLSIKIASRRLQLAGHCYRHPELSTQRLVLWEPKHGHRRRGRRVNTYIDTLKRDTGAHNVEELATMMENRIIWRKHVLDRLRSSE